jgi:hypothetical protein
LITNSIDLETVKVSEHSKTIETLEELPHILDGKGWQLVNFYKAHRAIDRPKVYQKALAKASEHVSHVGIRNFAYKGVTYYEVWVREKRVADSAQGVGVATHMGSCDV